MRLFIAVELCEEARRVVERAGQELATLLGRQVTARWTSGEKLHITVRFIGHVPDDRTPALIQAAIAPLAIRPFDVRFGGCGVFPPHGAPRVLWIGLDEGLPSLGAINSALNDRLAPFGYEPEPRAFSAHVTLARITSVKSGAHHRVREQVRRFASSSASCRVTELTLFRSHLSPAGSRYEALAQVPFLYS
jgi:2'-5' RNA ligase